MGQRTGVSIRGDKQLAAMLRELPRRAASTVNRRAVNKAVTPLLRSVKDEVPVDEGDLRRAQIRKITSRGATANGIVGADRAATGRGEGGEEKIPSKYDHLVTYGHAKPDGGMTEPNPYLERAWDAAAGAIQGIYETEVAAGIEREAAKLGGG